MFTKSVSSGTQQPNQSLFSQVAISTQNLKYNHEPNFFLIIFLDQCTRISLKLQSFDNFWTVLKTPKMRPCWQPN